MRPPFGGGWTSPWARRSWVVVGEDKTFRGGHDWLAEHGIETHPMHDPPGISLMEAFVAAHPDVWNEDIGDE